jgi:tetratricopeptide (TPR) repeat protein
VRPAVRYGLIAAVLLAAGAPALSDWLRERRAARTSDDIRVHGDALMRQGDYRAAVAEYQRAISLDPVNARAYGALAHALHRQAPHDFAPRPPGMSPSVQAAAKGVAVDPACGPCHGTLGFFLFCHEWQWEAAEQHLRDAVRLAPDDESIRPSYAMLLAVTGRPDAALVQIDTALARQPYHAGWRAIRASILYFQRRYPEALGAADDVLALNDRDRGGWEWRSRSLLQMHRDDEAVHAISRGLFPEHAAMVERAAAGGVPDGLRALLDLTAEWPRRVEQSWRRAAWFSLLGDSDAAIDALEIAYDTRAFNLIYLGADPLYDRLRSDTRFTRLLQRMGLDRYFPSAPVEARRVER